MRDKDLVHVGAHVWSRKQTAGTPVGPLLEEIATLREQLRQANSRIAGAVEQLTKGGSL